MRYTWLILDADGTLLDFVQAERIALERTPQDLELAIPSTFVSVYEEINADLWARFEQGWIAARDVRQQRFQAVFERLQIDADADAFSEAFLQNVIRESVFEQGAEQVLAHLRGRVGLLLLTNGFSDVQRARIERMGLKAAFDHVIISEEVGVAKPDPAIFDLALARMGDPDRGSVLVVGDSLASDILGGRNSGLDTCWYNPRDEPAQETITPTYTIRRLDELYSLIAPGGPVDA